jgi:hypothetical protein
MILMSCHTAIVSYWPPYLKNNHKITILIFITITAKEITDSCEPKLIPSIIMALMSCQKAKVSHWPLYFKNNHKIILIIFNYHHCKKLPIHGNQN